MSSLWHLTRLYLVGNIRRQVHLVTVALVFVMAMLPAYVNTFSLGVSGLERVAKDMGLTLIGYYGVALALFLGATAVPADREARTIFPILARPVPRLFYLAAQFLSISILIGASLFSLAAILGFAISRLVEGFDPGIFTVTGLYLVESMVLTSACLALSTVASPPLVGVAGAFLYIVGGLSQTFVSFFILEDRGALFVARLVTAVKSLLPSFEVFHLKNAVVHVLAVPSGYVPAAVAYGVGWMVLYLLLGNVVFEGKDL